MNTIKAVIFDLDGVLCHTDKLHFQAWKQACSTYGFNFTETDNNALRGVSRLDCVAIILSKQVSIPADFNNANFATEKNALYEKFLSKDEVIEMDPVVPEVLGKLKDRGIHLAVGSSSCNAKLIIEKLGIGKYFEAIVDGNILTKSKPCPEVFIRAADRIGVLCKECIVVEDSEAGIQAAKNGGFYTAGMGDAINTQDIDWYLDSISDLLQISELCK